MTEKNQTAQDAYARISLAKFGSLVEPSEEYLHKLRSELYVWVEQVEEATRRLWREQARREESAAEEEQ